MPRITVAQLFEDNRAKLRLEWIAGREGGSRQLDSREPRLETPIVRPQLRIGEQRPLLLLRQGALRIGEELRDLGDAQAPRRSFGFRDGGSRRIECVRTSCQIVHVIS